MEPHDLFFFLGVLLYALAVLVDRMPGATGRGRRPRPARRVPGTLEDGVRGA